MSAVCLLGMALLGGCAEVSSVEGSAPEVATSAVSGAINNSGGTTLGWNTGQERPRWTLASVLDRINLVSTAWAAGWSCTGGTLDPAFAGPGDYTFTPRTCTITWRNGKTASSSWSTTFTLAYGAACDAQHEHLERQAAGCVLTRTTAAGGNTRTLVGPNGGTYAIMHDTNGAGTGWDATVSPAPTNDGVVHACPASGCTTSRSLVINGSHLTGTLERAGSSKEHVWDHTISTDATGLTITGTGTSRVVTGSMTVQHNLAQYTSTVSFDAVGYGDDACCFPTTGTVTALRTAGLHEGKSDTLTFSAICGEATLTTADGTTEAITLKHCL